MAFNPLTRKDHFRLVLWHCDLRETTEWGPPYAANVEFKFISFPADAPMDQRVFFRYMFTSLLHDDLLVFKEFVPTEAEIAYMLERED